MKIRHLLLDFEGIQKNLKLLDDPNKLAIVMIRAAEVASMTALSWSFQKYLPQGLTVTVYLAESHLLISTTPENKECNIDVSVCKESSDLEAVEQYFKKLFKPKNIIKNCIERGSKNIEIKG
jgi:S-adenosylmethionine decarboxylase